MLESSYILLDICFVEISRDFAKFDERDDLMTGGGMTGILVIRPVLINFF